MCKYTVGFILLFLPLCVLAGCDATEHEPSRQPVRTQPAPNRNDPGLDFDDAPHTPDPRGEHLSSRTRESVIVLGNNYVFCAVQNGAWLDGQLIDASIVEQRTYTLLSNGQTAMHVDIAAGQTESQRNRDPLRVPIFDQSAASPRVAISCPWDPLPRRLRACSPETLNAQQIEQVQDFLILNGIYDAQVDIQSLYQVDLDADGSNEMILNVTSHPESILPDSKGFALVMLLYHETAYPLVFERTDWQASPLELPRCDLILDADGDSILEMLVEKNDLEQHQYTLYALTASTPLEVMRLSTPVGY